MLAVQAEPVVAMLAAQLAQLAYQVVARGELLVLVAPQSQARAAIPLAAQERAVLEAELGRKEEALQMRLVAFPAREHSVAAVRPVCRVAAWVATEAEALEAVAPVGRSAVARLLVAPRGELLPLHLQADVLATWALLVNQSRRDLTCSLASCRSFTWLDVRARKEWPRPRKEMRDDL
jgi:hypothetical protein